MRISNKTHYRTRDLARFFRAGLHAMGASLKKRIEVRYSRRNCHWGCATVGEEFQGTYIMMTLPRDQAKLDLKEFALTFEHEVAHNLGLNHGDMNPDTRFCRGRLPRWAAGCVISVKPPAPKVDVVARRQEHARRMLDAWERRLRRTQKVVARWRRKVSYYNRRAAAKEAR